MRCSGSRMTMQTNYSMRTLALQTRRVETWLRLIIYQDRTGHPMHHIMNHPKSRENGNPWLTQLLDTQFKNKMNCILFFCVASMLTLICDPACEHFDYLRAPLPFAAGFLTLDFLCCNGSLFMDSFASIFFFGSLGAETNHKEQGSWWKSRILMSQRDT